LGEFERNLSGKEGFVRELGEFERKIGDLGMNLGRK